MKNFKCLLMAKMMVLFLLATTQVGATAITSLEIIPIQSEKMFLLAIKAKGQGKVSIQFVDAKEQVLFSSEIKNREKFNHKFKLNDLPNGHYKLIIEDELKSTEQPILIDSEGVAIDPSTRQHMYKPHVKVNQASNWLDLNWLMATKGTFQLEISDDAANVLYTEQINDAWAVHQRYDVKNFPRGNYFLKIKGNNQVFYKEFYLN